MVGTICDHDIKLVLVVFQNLNPSPMCNLKRGLLKSTAMFGRKHEARPVRLRLDSRLRRVYLLHRFHTKLPPPPNHVWQPPSIHPSPPPIINTLASGERYEDSSRSVHGPDQQSAEICAPRRPKHLGTWNFRDKALFHAEVLAWLGHISDISRNQPSDEEGVLLERGRTVIH